MSEVIGQADDQADLWTDQATTTGPATCPRCGHTFKPGTLPERAVVAVQPRKTGSQAGKIGGSNRILSMGEAAAYLGLTYWAFTKRYKRDHIPFHKLGDHQNSPVKFRERDLEAYLDRNRWE